MIQEIIFWWLILLKKIAEKIKNESWKGTWGCFQTIAVAGWFLYSMKPDGCAAQERVLWSKCPPADHIAGMRLLSPGFRWALSMCSPKGGFHITC